MNNTQLKTRCATEFDDRLRLWNIYNMAKPSTEDIIQFLYLTLKYPDADLNKCPFEKMEC